MKLPVLPATAIPTAVFLLAFLVARTGIDFGGRYAVVEQASGLKFYLGSLALVVPLSVTNFFSALGTNAAMRALGNHTTGFMLFVAATTMGGALLVAAFFEDLTRQIGGFDLRESFVFWATAVLNSFGCILLAARQVSKYGD